MSEQKIDKLIEQTLQSFDGVKRAEPKPFLLTRVLAVVNRQPAVKSIWTRASVFISRPGIAVAGVALIMFVNISFILLTQKDTDKSGIIQNNASVTDEFAVNAANIYDVENPEAQ